MECLSLPVFKVRSSEGISRSRDTQGKHCIRIYAKEP